MTVAAGLTLEPVPGLIATFEVCDADRVVLGVIARMTDTDWRVLSTRYGAPEPQRGPFLSADAAAATLLTERNPV